MPYGKWEVGISDKKKVYSTYMSKTELKQQENTWVYITTGVIHP